MQSFIELSGTKNGIGNDLKIDSFSSFRQNVAFLIFKAHFLQGIIGKIHIFLLIIIFGP